MTGPTPFVLIVDDDLDHVVIARTVIRGVAPDVRVEACMDVRTAQRSLAEAPDSAIVFIDRILSGVESIPLVEQASATRPDLCLVLMSSSLSVEDQRRALDAGAMEAVEKPGNLDEWRRLVQGILTSATGDAGSEGRGFLAG